MTDSKNKSTCEGCAHFEWEQDMGASYPSCSLKGEYEPERCDEFIPSKLYRIYLEMVGKEAQR